MTQSKHLLRYRRIKFYLAMPFVGIWMFQPNLTMAQQGYEPAATLSASQILPPELLAGPNHRV
ncbi:MAG TPA: hypothetical protein VH985_17905, partial [Candidatus Binatia bacterium]